MLDATVVLIAILLVLCAWLVAQVLGLRRRLDAIPKDGNVLRLLQELDEDLAKNEALVSQYGPRIASLEETLPSAITNVGVVAYNAFGNIAGNQSRSLALLNVAGDGLVLSVLVGRDETLFFAKQVRAFAGEETLSPEELAAVERAFASATPQ